MRRAGTRDVGEGVRVRVQGSGFGIQFQMWRMALCARSRRISVDLHSTAREFQIGCAPPNAVECGRVRLLEISVESSVRCQRGELALIRRVATEVARAEGFRRGQLSIGIVGAKRMATMHLRYSGVSGPTDVLTFDLGTSPKDRHLDGTIVVCAAVAEREAGKRGRAAELTLYVTHGILHLAGYDDHDERDFRRMHAREDELLTQLGLGAVFSRRRVQRARTSRRR